MKPPLVATLCCAIVTGLANPSAAQYESDKRVNFTGVPIIDNGDALGWGVGGMALFLYPLSTDDTVSPPSATGVFGYVTTNETWVVGAAQKFFFSQDTYRATLIGAKADINFQVSQQNLLPILPDGFIPFNTQTTLGKFEFSRVTFKNLYVGASYRISQARTEFDLGLPDPVPPPELPLRRFGGLGLIVDYDTRDNIFNPSEGLNISSEFRFNREAFGSEAVFETSEIEANGYWGLRPGHVVATRFKTKIGTGDVPFEAQAIIGGVDLRGYSSGEHRGDQLYAAQAEYRWNFYGRWGMVGFAGFGWAVDDISDIALANTLPSYGTGIRFRAVQDYNLNVGFDVGCGKDGCDFRIMIGEAF